MKDRSDDPSHHKRTLLPRSYISLPVLERRVFSAWSERIRQTLGIAYHWLALLTSLITIKMAQKRNVAVVRKFAHGAMGHRSFMVNPLSYFSFQPVLRNLCNKGRGMCYPVCGMVHIKVPLLLTGNSSPCSGIGFPLSIWVVLYHMSDTI